MESEATFPHFSFRQPANASVEEFCKFGNVLVLFEDGLAPLNTVSPAGVEK